jgi:RNA-binding protein YlmH
VDYEFARIRGQGKMRLGDEEGCTRKDKSNKEIED